MKTSSTHQSNPSLSKIYITENCDCICHHPEDIEMNDENSFFQNNPPPNIQSKKYVQSTLKKKYIKKKIQKIYVYVIKHVHVPVIVLYVYVVLV